MSVHPCRACTTWCISSPEITVGNAASGQRHATGTPCWQWCTGECRLGAASPDRGYSGGNLDGWAAHDGLLLSRCCRFQADDGMRCVWEWACADTYGRACDAPLGLISTYSHRHYFSTGSEVNCITRNLPTSRYPHRQTPSFRLTTRRVLSRKTDQTQ